MALALAHRRTSGSNRQRSGFADQAVSHAIRGIARAHGCVVQQQPRGLRQPGRLGRLERLRDSQGLAGAAGPVQPWRAGNDAVEIAGKPLGRLHRLTSSSGTAVPVGIPRRPLVMRRDDPLGGHRHLVRRAPAEVDDLLGMSGREARGIARVPGVGRRGRVASLHCGLHRAVGDRAGEAAVSDRLELAVPAGQRHPHFDLDVGVSGRLQCRADPAERRGRGERRLDGAGRHDLRERDRRIRQGQRRQALARRGGAASPGDEDAQDDEDESCQIPCHSTSTLNAVGTGASSRSTTCRREHSPPQPHRR